MCFGFGSPETIFVSQRKFKQLTLNHVYRPLARSNGKVLELTQANRANRGKRWQRLHQFLSEIGVKVLRNHNGQLLGIARIARDRVEYETACSAFRRTAGTVRLGERLAPIVRPVDRWARDDAPAVGGMTGRGDACWRVFETVPGLIVSQHSGEGKANQ